MKTFKQLGVCKPMLKSINKLGFEKPTLIQEKSIPEIMQGNDVIAGSATGSGKTLAFASGVINKCEKGNGVQAIILVPTRELANQVAKAIRKLSKFSGLKVLPVYGGVSINRQIHKLKGTDIVVGTPGRTLDHLQRRTMNLDYVNIVVLDEADRMLDMGFIDDVEQIICKCPKDRQTLLFSATIRPEISRLAKKYMDHQVKISGTPLVDPRDLKQSYIDVPKNLKFSLLVHLLEHEDAELVMVFCNTRKTVDFISKNLKSYGINAIAIHGGYSQAKRERTMRSFKSQRVNVLVCTDVAARGLDIDDITHVYNYDLPRESKRYVHRIGRTARAGEKGKAITLLAERDHRSFSRILRDFSLDIKKEQMPQVKRRKVRWVPNRRRGRRHHHKKRRRHKRHKNRRRKKHKKHNNRN
ncbi:MAG: putative ATP-dependent RNA helicase [Candidatus Woesearchaeota archaeon]|nr:putative ATP-dependent RNA helicase [Candidatus Woesearchaeota archaeon]